MPNFQDLIEMGMILSKKYLVFGMTPSKNNTESQLITNLQNQMKLNYSNTSLEPISFEIP